MFKLLIKNGENKYGEFDLCFLYSLGADFCNIMLGVTCTHHTGWVGWGG